MPAANEPTSLQRRSLGHFFGLRFAVATWIFSAAVVFAGALPTLLTAVPQLFGAQANENAQLIVIAATNLVATISVLTVALIQGMPKLDQLLEELSEAKANARIASEEASENSKKITRLADTMASNTNAVNAARATISDVRDQVIRPRNEAATVVGLSDTQFGGGRGHVITQSGAFVELMRIEDKSGILFKSTTKELPASAMRLERNSKVSKWTALLHMHDDRTSLLNCCAFFVLIEWATRVADERGEPLDLDKLDIRALFEPSPPQTRVILPRGNAIGETDLELLVYDWGADLHKGKLRRLRAGEEYDALLGSVMIATGRSVPISFSEVKNWLGAAAPKDGYLSHASISARLAGSMTSVTDLLRRPTYINLPTERDDDHFVV
jgi:hypothetical protein